MYNIKDKTSELNIINEEESLAEALDLADGYIKRQGLEKKRALHLRLLVEETIGMIGAMTGDFNALFWIEHEKDEYRVRLSATTNMNKAKKEELLSVSKSGKNAAVKGFMSKISDMIDNGLLYYNDVMMLQQQYSGGYIMGYGMMTETPVMGEPFMWSLQEYRQALQNADTAKEEIKEASDELERSIVASIAKDVIVGVKNDTVDMTIIY